jgi:aminopeptidase N
LYCSGTFIANHTCYYIHQQAANSSQAVDVSEIMNTWVRQMGYPVVTMDIQGDVAQLSQQRFLSDPEHADSGDDTSPYK